MKPFSTDTLEMIVGKAQEHLSLIEENQSLRQQISSHSFPKIIGESPSMKKILEEVNNVATSHASVFITGESGTGKEVIAHAIHHHSPRKSHPFIKVNCAAIPEALMESEFFGHEKGAFTGASTRHLGRFELANKGTLLLDEVTEIPSGLQAKLLRVTQEQEFDRVGGSKPIKVDVRLISTSNRNIRETLQKKILREDLFYRLNVIPIHIPPLRERREDIIPLAEFFIEKMCLDNHKEKKTLSQEAKDKLLSYAWPGNVRELANIIERAVVTYSSNKISPEQLILEGQLFPLPPPFATSLPIGMTLQELEKQLIIETLHTHQNNKTKTAAILGISLNTLQTKLNKYQLKID